jgi:HEAT repeat protein
MCAAAGSGVLVGSVRMGDEVFISRTSDMAEYPAGGSFAAAALEAVIQARRVPVDMGYFAARDGEPVSYCRERVRDADVYVAVVGLRYGSLVPGEDVSYTECEFREATEAGRPRLVFLLDEDAPIPRKFVDLDPGRIDDFRTRLQREGLITATFTTPDMLRHEVYKAFAELAGGAGRLPELAGPYLKQVQSHYRRLDLAVLTPEELDEQLPVLLSQVFVAQGLRAEPPPVELSKELLRRLVDDGEIDPGGLPEGVDAERWARARAAYAQRPVRGVLDVLGEPDRRLVVLLGDPGSGKSTLARFVVLTLAGGSCGPGALAGLAGWLPLLVELRAFARERAQCPTFLAYWERLYATEGLGLPAGVLEDYLGHDGRAVVVFDGLDEVFDPAEREAVARQIAGFAARYPRVRIVVTSRVIGYRRVVLDAAGFAHYTVQDLDRVQIGEFVDGWYRLALHDRPGEANAWRERLLAAVDAVPSIRELAGNPMLLTILAVIGRRRELPRERCKVYEHAAAVLVEHWDVNRHLEDASVRADYIDAEDRREMLRRVAARMQAGRAGLAGNHIRGADLVEEIEGYLRRRYGVDAASACRAARVMLARFRERNFVLTLYGGEVYGFVHRAFLEYFCADEIVGRFQRKQELPLDELIEGVVGEHWADEAWQEVILLIGGMVDERFSAQIVDYLVRRANPLWRLSPGKPPRNAALAARCLVEARNTGMAAAQGQAVLDMLIDLLKYFDDRSPSACVGNFSEEEVLPALRSVGARWPDRRQYLDWFLTRGVSIAWTPTSTLAAQAMEALFPDSSELRALLRAHAEHDSRWRVRRAAVQALASGWPGDSDTRALLVQHVFDGDGSVRRAAVEGLASGWPGDSDTRDLLVRRALDDGDEDVREAAVQGLASGWPGDPDARDLFARRAADDVNWAVRRAAVQALASGWPGVPDTRALLARRAFDDGDGSVRRAAVEGLASGWPGDPETRDLLVRRALDDGDEDVREAAVQGLASGWPGDPDTHDLLVQRALDDGDEDVREAAVQGLASGWPGDPRTRDLFARRAADDVNWAVRRAAVQALASGWPGDPRTRDLLFQRAVDDADEDVRRTVVQGLASGWPGDPDTRDLLAQRAVDDADGSVRRTAVEGLAVGWPGDPDTRALLAQRAFTDGSVREAALQALRAYPQE